MKTTSRFLVRFFVTLTLATMFISQIQSQTVSQFVYGDRLTEEGFSIFETHDSLMIFTGYTDSLDTSGLAENNVYLVKIDRDGNHSWSNGYRIDSDERGCLVLKKPYRF